MVYVVAPVHGEVDQPWKKGSFGIKCNDEDAGFEYDHDVLCREG